MAGRRHVSGYFSFTWVGSHLVTSNTTAAGHALLSIILRVVRRVCAEVNDREEDGYVSTLSRGGVGVGKQKKRRVRAVGRSEDVNRSERGVCVCVCVCDCVLVHLCLCAYAFRRAKRTLTADRRSFIVTPHLARRSPRLSLSVLNFSRALEGIIT